MAAALGLLRKVAKMKPGDWDSDRTYGEPPGITSRTRRVDFPGLSVELVDCPAFPGRTMVIVKLEGAADE